MGEFKVFTGTANSELAKEVCGHLDVRLGQALVTRHNDGETRVEIRENMRNLDGVIIQSTCPPVNDALMELLLLNDALRRSAAEKIFDVIPYFGYGRQDRRRGSEEGGRRSDRTPISARVVADCLEATGMHRALSVELHCGQLQGFFHRPIDNLFAKRPFLEDIRKILPDAFQVVFVSADAGGLERAKSYAETYGKNEPAVSLKRRSQPGKPEFYGLLGEVAGRDIVIVEDMIDTGGTVCGIAQTLKERGARSIRVYAAHGIFSGKAISKIAESALTEVVVTNTIPLPQKVQEQSKIRQVSIAALLAEAIKRMLQGKSISALNYEPQ